MGSCLGGGFELALACHYRMAMAHEKTSFGFPEVKLGLLPGGGGTQRILTSVGGIDEALKMVLTGSTLNAPRAKRSGVVHSVVQPLGPGAASPSENTLAYLEEVAIQNAKSVASFGIFGR